MYNIERSHILELKGTHFINVPRHWNRKWISLMGIVCCTLLLLMLLFYREANYALKPDILIPYNLQVYSVSSTSERPNTARSSKKPGVGMSCFMHYVSNDDHDILWLEDVMTADKRPAQGKNIFFHETSCQNGIIRLNARQACAIESAALTNPTWNVFVLFASPVGFEYGVPKLPIIEALESYSNVYLRNLNLWTYAENTPAEEWIQTGQLFKSKYLSVHTADFIRLLSLYKWGGTHIDLDFIMKKSLSTLSSNYAGTESEGYIANGLLNFNQTGFGHDMVTKCLHALVNQFNGNSWTGIGPLLITRILGQFCDIQKCEFTKLPIDDLYAIHYTEWEKLFDEAQTEMVLNRTHDSIAVHFWNKLSFNKTVIVGADVAYGRLAAEYCPKVYRTCEEYF